MALWRKMHIGVDSTLGLIHSIFTTPANVHDIVASGKLLHGKESYVSGDAGYLGIQKRDDHKERKVDWLIGLRPGTRKRMEKASPEYQLETVKSGIRGKSRTQFRHDQATVSL